MRRALAAWSVGVLAGTALGTGGTAAAETPSAALPGASSATPVVSGQTTAALPPVVLPPAPAGAADAADVRAALRAPLRARALGSAASVMVTAAGTTLFAQRAGKPHPPASTAKLLTAAAALEALGPRHRLVTRVVAAEPAPAASPGVPATPPVLVLVGGGDATLQSGARPPDLHHPSGDTTAYARLDRLADQVATVYRGRTVRLRIDDTVFAGPAADPDWEPGYVRSGVVAPVHALEVDEGRVRRGSDDRAADPALAAGKLLATQLKARGVRVSGAVTRTRAPATATEVARVQSPPVADLVERMLTLSDNDLAEALARLTALAEHHRPDAASADTVVAVVRGLGVPVTGVRLLDGSGLARGSAVPARTLAAVLALSLNPGRPELRPLLTGLPVAGATGTLSDRYARGGPAAAGRGDVRGKTGTLTGVSTLAGVVQPRTGPPLVFALMAGGVQSTATTRAALDAVAAALARCACAAPTGRR